MVVLTARLRRLFAHRPQVAAGREWFIHTIYTVRSRENANRGIGKRSLEYHSVSRHGRPRQPRSRRSAAELPELVEGIGTENDRGTNILHIALDRGPGAGQRGPGPQEDAPLPGAGVVPRELNRREEDDEQLVLIIGVFVGLLLTVLVAVVIALLVRSRKDKSAESRKPPVSASTEPMVGGGGGGDSSEV